MADARRMARDQGAIAPIAEAEAAMSLAGVLQLARAAACQRGLTLYETKILVVMATMANPEGLAWPARSTLAALTGIDERHVARATKQLVARGLVELLEAGGPKTAARYRLAVGKMLDGALTDPGAGEGGERDKRMYGKLSRACRGTADVPVEARQGRLYRHGRRASAGTPDVPVEAPEVPMKDHLKGPLKVATEGWSASRSARAPGKAPRVPRAVPSGGKGNLADLERALLEEAANG